MFVIMKALLEKMRRIIILNEGMLVKGKQKTSTSPLH